MNLQPLKQARGDEASGHIQIRCCVTRVAARWNEAARAGWKADLQGQSFNAYYSPEGQRQLEARTRELQALHPAPVLPSTLTPTL